ncbi:MAG: site-specific integrase, partial [Xanthobacteraceae bacterium]
MARRVRDANLETREARSRLKPRGKPYWRSLERGLHLDYRRLRGKGNVRHYLGDQRYEIKQIGIADDLSDADGVAILDMWQAQTAAREQMVKRAHAAGG